MCFSVWISILPTISDIISIIKGIPSNEESKTLNHLAHDTFEIQYAKKFKTDNHHPDPENQKEGSDFYQAAADALKAAIQNNPAFAKLSASEQEACATLYYPLIPIGKSDDLKLMHFLFSEESPSKTQPTQKLLLKVPPELSLPDALAMAYELKYDAKTLERREKSVQSLPPEVQHIAERPDIPSLSYPTQVQMGLGQKPKTLNDEVDRWKLFYSDPYFRADVSAYQKHKITDDQVLQKVEDVTTSLTQVYTLIEKRENSRNKSLSIDDATQLLFVNKLVSDPNVTQLILEYEEKNPGRKSTKEVEIKLAQHLLDYYEQSAKGNPPDDETFGKETRAILESGGMKIDVSELQAVPQ